MKTVGLPISRKNNERRRALLPQDLEQMKNVKNLYFESGYGEVLGFSDEDYKEKGAKIVNFEEVISKDIVCDPKIGDEYFLDSLKEKQTIFGWVHAVQNKDITEKLIKNKLTVYAWEDMYDSGRHVFWKNNQIAGEAAIIHAFEHYGAMPNNLKVAILGRGNVANGALRVLTCLGADVTIYNKYMEQLFVKELPKYDVVVNGILWDITRKDHIIYRNDLKRMKKNSLIVDISCDKSGAVETSIPTTIDDPVYIVDGIIHYVVDHTPSIFYRDASTSISDQVKIYLDELIEDKISDTLKESLIIENGNIIDQKIKTFQNFK